MLEPDAVILALTVLERLPVPVLVPVNVCVPLPVSVALIVFVGVADAVFDLDKLLLAVFEDEKDCVAVAVLELLPVSLTLRLLDAEADTVPRADDEAENEGSTVP